MEKRATGPFFHISLQERNIIMEKLLAFLDKFNKTVCKICKFLAAVCVGAFTVITFAQVIGRNFLKIPMIWSIDMCTLLFTWCVFLGCILGVYYRSHYIVELFPERMEKTNTSLDLLVDIIVACYFFWLVKYGIGYTKIGMKGIMESMLISKAWCYVVIPISGGIMFWMNLQWILKDFWKLVNLFKKPKTAE